MDWQVARVALSLALALHTVALLSTGLWLAAHVNLRLVFSFEGLLRGMGAGKGVALRLQLPRRHRTSCHCAQEERENATNKVAAYVLVTRTTSQ
jgi:hypothetical protein